MAIVCSAMNCDAGDIATKKGAVNDKDGCRTCMPGEYYSTGGSSIVCSIGTCNAG